MAIIYVCASQEKDLVEVKTVVVELWKSGHEIVTPISLGFLPPHTYKNLIAVADAILIVDKSYRKLPDVSVDLEFAQNIGVPIFNCLDEILEFADNLPKDTNKQFLTLRILLGRLYRLLVKKNMDYGSHNISQTGEIGVVIRINDKVQRLLNLMGFKDGEFNPSLQKENFESIEDTWIDIAGYALIACLLRKNVWGK